MKTRSRLQHPLRFGALFTLLFWSGWWLSTPLQAQQSERKVVEVAPHLQLQYGAFFKQLKIVCSDERVDEIEGFDFEWGYQYRLEIDLITLQVPPADGSSYEAKLRKLLAREPVPADYSFALWTERDALLGPGEQEPALTQLTDSTYRYLDAVDILVPADLRTAFETAATEERSRWQCRISGPQQIRLLARLP